MQSPSNILANLQALLAGEGGLRGELLRSENVFKRSADVGSEELESMLSVKRHDPQTPIEERTIFCPSSDDAAAVVQYNGWGIDISIGRHACGKGTMLMAVTLRSTPCAFKQRASHSCTTLQ